MILNDMIDIKERRDELKGLIQTRKNDLFLLLDYATNYKQAERWRRKLKKFQNDPMRLVRTMKDLHLQIRELQKEFILLNELLNKAAESKEKNNVS
jgi:hypothetical protein